MGICKSDYEHSCNDALVHSEGDESQVADYLHNTYGKLLINIPTLGEGSSYQYDLVFNADGYNGIVPGQNQTYADKIREIISIINRVSKKYPGIKIQSEIVTHILSSQISPPRLQGLDVYLEIHSGTYTPSQTNTGIITDAKSDNVAENISIQSEATFLQASRLSQVQDDHDLLEWFGIHDNVFTN